VWVKRESSGFEGASCRMVYYCRGLLGLWGWGGGNVSVKQADRDEVQIDLILQRGMVCVCLGSGMRMLMSMMMARWSETVSSELERWSMVIPVEQTRSRMCPRLS